VLIKDNHLCVEKDIERAIKKSKRFGRVEIEVKDLEELKKAAVSGADIILLDNMSLKMLRKCVRAARAIEKKRSKKILLEASGGITLENVRAVAKTGVDYISVGALTHSPKALDLSLEIVKCR
jgi:nicotinate-nucleotide pyrophosphorylase (carboxylating)